MRLWGGALAFVLIIGALAVGASGAKATPPFLTAGLIRVDDGTSVTIWEKTGPLTELTYSVATLKGPGGTYNSAADESYTFTSDGVYLKIHMTDPWFKEGSLSGNNIAGSRLDGVPGHPSGLWASTIFSYIVGYGGVESSRFNALGDDLSTHTWMGDQVSELVLGFTVDVANRPPVIASFPPIVAPEGGPVDFSVTAYDPEGAPLQYRWDFDGDGTWDTGWATNSTATYTWGDDWTGTVRAEVTDGTLSTGAATSVLVGNANPVVTALAIGRTDSPCPGDEHGDHDGEHEHDDDCGDSDDDANDCPGHDDGGGGDDDDEEGCGVTVTFNATAVDPGSDDITFVWDFGDGTNASRTYYNDGVSPDPYPSPGPTFPVNATNETTHVYTVSGNFTVTLTVTDDDGGNVTITQHVLVCGDDGEHGDHDGQHEHEDGCGDGERDEDHGDGDDGCGEHDDDGSQLPPSSSIRYDFEGRSVISRDGIQRGPGFVVRQDP